MTSIVPSQCNACARLRPGRVTCDAFPDGIPSLMLTQLGDHSDRPLPHDHGLRFKQAEGQEAADAFDLWERVSGA
jgi:hypothetical protein